MRKCCLRRSTSGRIEVLKELEISQNVKNTDICRLKSNESVAKKVKSEFLPTKFEFSTRFEKGYFFQN